MTQFGSLTARAAALMETSGRGGSAACAPAKTERFSTTRIPALDGLRGIAILFVLLVHSSAFLAPEIFPQIARQFLGPLWVGVNIFFVLSGFLITGILLDTKQAPHYFKSFYMRRVLRIFPLYFGALAVVFFLLPFLRIEQKTPLGEQLWLWSYLSNWHAARGHGIRALSHFWSLAVEEQFYLLWPILVYFSPRRYLPILCGIGIGCAFLFRSTVIGLGHPIRYAYFSTPARVEDLAIGALTAWVVRDSFWFRRARDRTVQIGILCTLGFVLACALGRGFESTKGPAVLFGTTTISVLTGVVILLTVVLPGQQDPTSGLRLRRALSLRPLRWLGTYSYGIYVFHLPLMVWAHTRFLPLLTKIPPGERTAAAFGVTAAAVTISCGIAFLSYNCFEKHFLKLKSRFESV